ncbi:hypothetical protein [Azospirillum canadense]|uniref:hypothetical protein n=1 Tax=Azospirillum canadense TaxID=403962 RepID=UPI00222753E2|nr:hypothetical protein [Azospirillum canadense]MCW2240552.1 hypothetical protein [Azospirillum canadense]
MRGKAVLLLFAVLMFGACQTSDTYSELRSIGATQTLLTTADLRLVTERMRPQGQRGGLDLPPQHVVCVEPSPDVAKALSTAFSLAANASVTPPTGGTALSGNVNPDLATAEQLAQLTERVPSIQALRDGLFRACEAYANGSIGDSAYSLILSRYGDILVTLLLGESAAGSYGRQLALLAGQSLQTDSTKKNNQNSQPESKPPTKSAPSASLAPVLAAASIDGTLDASPTGHALMVPAPPGTGTGMVALAATTENTPGGARTAKVADAPDKTIPTDAILAMQQNYLVHNLTGPMMVLCANILDPTRPLYSQSHPLSGHCSDYLQRIFARSVALIDAPAFQPTAATKPRPMRQ